MTCAYSFGEPIALWEPGPGDIATLQLGAVTVLVRITAAAGRKYMGFVIGFERWQEYEYKSLKPDDVVEFRREQAFGFMR